MPRIVIIGLVLAGGILGWLFWQKHRPIPLSVSGFVEADEIRVGSRIGGRVAEVVVDEGQRVTTGQPLFRVDPFDIKASLAEAEARCDAARAELDRLRAGFRDEEIEQARAKRDRASAVLQRLITGPRPEEIKIAEEDFKKAQAQLEWAESEYERVSGLRERADAAKAEYEIASRTLKTTRASKAAAEQQLNLLLEGTRTEDIAEARALLAEAAHGLELMEAGNRKEDIARAEAQVAAAEAAIAAIGIRLAETTVASPCDCVVESIELQPGDLVSPNAPSVSLLDLTHLWVRAYVPEAHLRHAELGRELLIRIDGFPDTQFPGRIVFVASEGEFTPRNVQTPEERGKQVFRIKVDLTIEDKRLRVGMAGDVLLAESHRP